MTKEQLLYVRKILSIITPQDEHVRKAVAYVEKDIAQFDARRGQMKEQYEADTRGYFI